MKEVSRDHHKPERTTLEQHLSRSHSSRRIAKANHKARNIQYLRFAQATSIVRGVGIMLSHLTSDGARDLAHCPSNPTVRNEWNGEG
jgi:hypothetical protein